jgi:hypothetical protein
MLIAKIACAALKCFDAFSRSDMSSFAMAGLASDMCSVGSRWV